MEPADPFAGLGKAIETLRKRAGYKTQLAASEALSIDKGQLSRWENEVPRPTLENLGRLLIGYGATAADLADALGGDPSELHRPAVLDEEDLAESSLLRSLIEAVRRVEGRQEDTDSRVERIERGLEAASRPAAPPSRSGDR